MIMDTYRSTALFSPGPPAASVTGRSGRPARGWLDWSKIAVQAIMLNALWLLGCLPVLTAPAATVAVAAAVHRWRAAGDPPSARQFVRDVRSCCWPALVIGVLFSAGVVFFAVDLIIIGQMGAERRVVLVLWFAAVAVVALASVSALPLAAADLASGRRLSMLILARQTAAEAFAHPGRAVTSVGVVTAIAFVVSFSPICLLVAGVSVAALLDLIVYGRSEHPAVR